jgi:succinyl-CoA synthetase beta subunit
MAARLSEIVTAEGLDVLEVNPAIVTGDRVVACDTKARRGR